MFEGVRDIDRRCVVTRHPSGVTNAHLVPEKLLSWVGVHCSISVLEIQLKAAYAGKSEYDAPMKSPQQISPKFNGRRCAKWRFAEP